MCLWLDSLFQVPLELIVCRASSCDEDCCASVVWGLCQLSPEEILSSTVNQPNSTLLQTHLISWISLSAMVAR